MGSRRRCGRCAKHGQGRKYHHDEIGWTARPGHDPGTRAPGKLPLLDGWNDERRWAADRYNEGLAGVGDLVLPDTSDRGQVWHLYVVLTADADGLAGQLAADGIGTGRHYPEPPHRSNAYRQLGYGEGSFPVAERIGRQAISLPMFPGISESQIDQVVERLRSWFDRG